MTFLTQAEYLQSKNKAEKLMCSLSSPKDEWEANQLLLIKIEVIIEDLKTRKIISADEERKMRLIVSPYLYRNIIANPLLKNKKIKKLVGVSLLNDWLYLIGLSKSIRFRDT